MLLALHLSSHHIYISSSTFLGLKLFSCIVYKLGLTLDTSLLQRAIIATMGSYGPMSEFTTFGSHKRICTKLFASDTHPSL